jgi:hypothetical protein
MFGSMYQPAIPFLQPSICNSTITKKISLILDITPEYSYIQKEITYFTAHSSPLDQRQQRDNSPQKSIVSIDLPHHMLEVEYLVL